MKQVVINPQTGKRDYVPKNNKVIFVGKGHGWWDCPQDCIGYDVWGINDLIVQKTSVDLLFNMHEPADYSEMDMASTKLAAALKIPIVMLKEYDHIPTSIAFPIEECMKEFDTDYISTAIPYMFAYALMKGYKQIDCYGVNMRGDDEKYKNAKACVEFWVGICKGRGVKVNFCNKYADMLKAFDRRIYGYNTIQTMPKDINDRAVYVTFGTGLDRVAMANLHQLLSKQKNSKYFDNMRPIPVNDPRMMGLMDNLYELTVKHGDGVPYVGDIGFYNMLHIDPIINNEHSCRVIILEGNKEEVIKDWLFFAQDFNLWTMPKSKHWNGDKDNPAYSQFFPKYDLPKNLAIDKFYDEYYIVAARAQYKFPGYIKIFNSNILDSKEGQMELLTFIGYKNEDMILDNKEEVCQTKKEESVFSEKAILTSQEK